ncbi:MAG: hypothetical protein J6K22_02275 [Spirochaetaceae bacterium]|nr:hypothetical protein [Spirochaetaceae bacterium]
MKKIALFLMMIMACFMFFSCDMLTGTGGDNGGVTGEQDDTENNGGTSGENTGTGGNTGTSGGSSGGSEPEIELPPAKDEPSKEDTKDLLKEAVDLLLETKIDEGIAKIREAYAEQQNSETAMYYALAELASISVDKSVETLLKENLGVSTYPSTMNALISGDWMKEYPIAYDRIIYEVTEDEYGSYVRVSGTKTDYYGDEDYEPTYIHAYLYEDEWVNSDGYLADVSLDENGDYLVDYYYLPEYIDYSTAKRYYCSSKFLGFEESKYGEYVKFSGTPVDLDDVVSGDVLVEEKGGYYSVPLIDIELSDDGKYFVRTYYLPEDIDTSLATKYSLEYEGGYSFEESEDGDYVRVNGTEIYRVDTFVFENDSWVNTNSYFKDVTVGSGDYFGYGSDLVEDFYDSSVTRYSEKYNRKMVQEGTVTLPEFNVPTWFKDTDFEEKFNSTYTAYSVSYLIAANALECNSNGLNELFDNILAVFGTKFANAKALAASLTDASVEIPTEVFDAFGLEELLDGQSSLMVGKAELNVLVASMEILKGTFQWLASYDWSVNLSYLKEAFIDDFYSEDLILDAFENTLTENTLTVRNVQLMTDSKNSFLSALSLVESSYNYLVGDTSQYPDVYVDSIKEYGDVYLQCVQSLKKAIQDGGIFYIPGYEWDGTSWPKTASNTMMQIDMGNFFTAGYLTDITERTSSGKVQFYIEIYVYDSEDSIFAPLNSFETLEEELEVIITNNGLENTECRSCICIALDADKIKDLLGTSFIDEIFGEEYIGTDTIYFPLGLGIKEPEPIEPALPVLPDSGSTGVNSN